MGPIQCPNCGEETLNVSCGKDDEKPVRCSNCDEEFSTADLRQVSDKLVQLCQWIESAPFRST